MYARTTTVRGDPRAVDDGIELPAGGQVEAVTDAVRMQLEDLTEPIAATDTVPVPFTFATAGEVRLDVPVVPGPGPVD